MTEYEKNYWNSRYKNDGNSGYGSYDQQLTKKLGWIKGLDGVKSISEYGCGDFHFGGALTKLFPESTYTGLDVSDFIVETNRQKWPEYAFKTSDRDLPPADLVLCVDVLFHVIDDREVEVILNRLEKAWTKYLVITAYERNEEKTNHVRIRAFDYKRFGEPVIREIVEADGSLYFYLFAK